MKIIDFETMADNTLTVRIELTQFQCNIIHKALLNCTEFRSERHLENKEERVRQFLSDEFFMLDDDFNEIERMNKEHDNDYI
jgi:hypothetical protein